MNVKTLRTDLTAFSLTGLVVVAAVVLLALHLEVPTWLSDLGLTSAGVGGGASVPATLGAFLGASTPSGRPAPTSTPAPAAAPLPPAAPAVRVAAAAVPAPVPGRDMTETFPAITATQVAADKAVQS